MSQQFFSPFPQFVDSTGAPYSGGTLTFYESGTSTPLDTYSDEAKTTANSNPLTLNSAGRPSSHIFLQDQDYKAVLKDSSGTTVWTADPVRGTDFDYSAQVKVGSGSPTGSVAGTAASSGVLPTFYWDYTNEILYICTTTGTTSTAVWTAINASAATPSVPGPQGYLTLVSGTPVATSDQSAKTAVYYTPDTGNLVPIYNGATFSPTTFTELTLTLAAGSHSADTLYDVFVFSDSGVLTLVTGPAWDTSTAGSGDRGTGASTTELQRINGFYVNAVSMTGTNDTDTYSIGANLATYLGSIHINSSAGQTSCLTSYGQARKWGVWNLYNQKDIVLIAGDATSTWVTADTDFDELNNDADNKITVFCGLANTNITCVYSQNIEYNTGTSPIGYVGLGVDSVTTASGNTGWGQLRSAGARNLQVTARHIVRGLLGISDIQMLEKHSASNITYYGGEDGCQLVVSYRG